MFWNRGLVKKAATQRDYSKWDYLKCNREEGMASFEEREETGLKGDVGHQWGNEYTQSYLSQQHLIQVLLYNLMRVE